MYVCYVYRLDIRSRYKVKYYAVRKGVVGRE